MNNNNNNNNKKRGNKHKKKNKNLKTSSVEAKEVQTIQQEALPSSPVIDSFSSTSEYSVEELIARFSRWVTPATIVLTVESLKNDLQAATNYIEEMAKLAEKETMQKNEDRKRTDLELLEKEFLKSTWTEDRIEEAYTCLSFDYERARNLILDLQKIEDFSAQITDLKRKEKAKASCCATYNTQLVPEGTVLLLPQNVVYMRQLFGEDGNQYSTFIDNEMKIQGFFPLPLDRSSWAVINQSLKRYMKDFYQLSLTKEQEAANKQKGTIQMTSQEETPDSCSPQDLSEIIAEQHATKVSSEEYRRMLEEKLATAKEPAMVEAILQELTIEAHKNLLFQRYPGLDPVMLVNIFEANGFDLFQAIEDIEPIVGTPASPSNSPKSSKESQLKRAKNRGHHQSLGGESRSSLASPMVGRNDSLSSSTSSSSVHSTPVNEETALRQSIKALVREREEVHACLDELKKSRTKRLKHRFLVNDIRDFNGELCDLSDRILELIENNLHLSTFDLHGLTISEVAKIVPTIVKHKLSLLITQSRVSLILITGQSDPKLKQTIHQWVRHFLEKGDYRYEMEGPGAFKVTLTPKHFPIKR